MKIVPGDAVLTKFGTGVVVRCFSTPSASDVDQEEEKVQDSEECNNSNSSNEGSIEWASIRLWRQPGKSIASCAVATIRLPPSQSYNESEAMVGDGGGEEEDQGSVILRKIVAAPGMIVRAYTTTSTTHSEDVDTSTAEQEETKENGQNDERATALYLIERYVPSNNVYLASTLKDNKDENDNVNEIDESVVVELTPQQIIQSSTSSKFYPMLQSLIDRGEAAWSLAVEQQGSSRKHVVPDTITEMKNIQSVVSDKLLSAVTIDGASVLGSSKIDVSSESAAKLISDASKSSISILNSTLQNNTSTIQNGHSTATTIAQNAISTTREASKSISIPQQTEEIKQIYTMLRDDDITTLLQRGKERLTELVNVDISSKTKETLSKIGIELDDDGEDGGSGMQSKMNKLRKETLSSIEMLMKMNIKTDENGNVVIETTNGKKVDINTSNILDPTLLPMSSVDVNELTQTTTRQFAQMFDHLSKVSTSDTQLLQIFNTISEKTKVWQEMTGRLLQTKTASLFMEGSQRLRVRAAEVLASGGGNIRTALNNSGGGVEGNGANANLTRAFTEGDIAKAKLKSLEMGDAVRSRLFTAIELRSESLGGLDAIIAGSLNKIQDTGIDYTSKAASLLGDQNDIGGGLKDLSLTSNGISEDNVQSIISKLQQSATSSMKNTKETLIALLSQRSGYRDSVLLRLERTFVDLESQLGQELSPSQIAQLVNGDGGSLSLFQPIANKAAKEIEVQLDIVESKMKESHNWNTNVDNVMGKVRSITRGELSMMDVLDLAAGYLDDEYVVSSTGGLIVKAESLLDNFEAASAKVLGDDSKTRNNILGSGGDASAGIMDAVAKAGITKDTVMKGVEGLDVNKLLDDTQSAMTDERARRELISSAGDTALDFLLKILPSMPVPPFDGVRDGLLYTLSNLSMQGFKVKKEDIYIEIAGIRAAAQKDESSSIPQSTRASVKASELLVIDIRNISATLDDAMWSFEQTYMPYLKGSGKANTRLWDGAIRMKFELRRHIVRMDEDPNTGEKTIPVWEPILCLNDRSCSIGGVELTIQGEGKITWVANKLASLLGTRLRDYVVNVIMDILKNNSGWLLDMLNTNLSTYWPFIMRTASLELDTLPKLAQHHVTKADVDEKQDELELVWRERLPLGLNILTNDESGYLKVIDLPRGTQARQVAQAKQLDPDLFKGSTIVSVNGRRYGPEQQVDLFAALKDPARPKAILFKLASQNDLQKMEKMAEQRAKGNSKAQKAGNNVKEVVVRITDEELGLKFTSHDNFALAVSAFLPDSNGQPRHVEKTGAIMLGDLLAHINGTVVLGEKQKALALLEEIGSRRPLDLGFVKPYLFNIVLEKDDRPENASFGGPSELVFTEVKSKTDSNENKIVLKDFAPAEGAAETGGVLVGDNLCFINGIPVGAGCRLLKNSDPPPKLGEYRLSNGTLSC